ncbi:hypothetical protein SDC9_184953 [bioreactor metagenome]|uniref:Uncharacterized protein n=1 Tax=bioreactor metagenome TaxID=1076179 RepID=A0A645HEH7_9ZZZZ
MTMAAVAKAAAKVPWKEILGFLSTLVTNADKIGNFWNSKPKPTIDPQAEIKNQITAIRERLEALEASEGEQNNLIRQIVEQLQTISIKAAGRSSVSFWLSVSALTVSGSTLLLVIFR